MKWSSILCILTIITSTQFNHTFAQCSWINGSDASDVSDADGWSVTYDIANNYYITGAFKESMSAGGISFTTPATANAFFAAKYDTDGNIVWGKTIETIDPAIAFPPKVDYANDKIYIAGASNGSIIIEGTTYGSGSHYNVFLIAITKEGVFDFVKIFKDSSATSLVYTGGLTHDAAGNMYMTGRFNGYLFMDGETLVSASSTTFVSKLTASGDVVWANKTASPGSSTSRGWGITVDNTNNVLLGGYFVNTLSYDTCNLSVTTAAGFNPYLIKIDVSGNCTWMKIGDGVQEFSHVYDVLTDAANNVYACGGYSGTLTWDGVSITDTGGPVFLVKSDASGNIKWVKNYGTFYAGSNGATAISFDTTGNIWMTGFQEGTSVYGGITLNNEGVFAVLLDTSGTVLKAVSGNGLAKSFASTTDAGNDLVVTGKAIGDTISFPGDVFYYPTDSSDGFFILKYCSDDTSVSIFSLNGYEKMIVYPNPAKNEFLVEISSEGAEEAVVSVYDVTGRKVRSFIQFINDGMNRIPVSIEQPGYYLIRVHTTTKQFAGKVLIE
ncbi:MAG: T9SS type A sorting domain-containing protein [Chitinophagales bacterium]|nr:T9SS type A sorting domain-containing protein [Chitinophagales bacterium]